MSARHSIRAGACVVRHVGPALALALGLGSFTACESTPAVEDVVFDPGDGTLQGELAVYIADDFELGVQTKKYAIRSAKGEERWLDLDDTSGLEARCPDQGVGESLRRPFPGGVPAPDRAAAHRARQVGADQRHEVSGQAAGVDPPRHRRRHEPHGRKRAEGDRRSVDEQRSPAAKLLRRGVVRHRGARRPRVWSVPVRDRQLQHQRDADRVPRHGRSDGRWNVQPLPLVHRIANVGLQLERSRRGGDARPAVERHLVQRLVELRGYDSGAWAQLRHAAFVVDATAGRRLSTTRPKATARTANTAIPTIRWAAAAAT